MLTAQAARSAAALHEAGIVHRDIKPTNVLLHTAPDGERRLLLADLGLAKSLAQASVLTLAAGSAGYQPPEQAEPGRASTPAPTSTAWARWATSWSPGPCRGRRGRSCAPAAAAGPRRGRRARAAARHGAGPGAALAGSARVRGRTGAAGGGLRRQAGPAARRRPGPARHRTLVLAAVLAAGAAAVTVTLVLQRPHAAEETAVKDSTGRVTVQVPAGWARQVRDSGWDPRALGLPSGHEPGLVVADDLAHWSDLRTTVDGVFLGVSEHGDVTARVNALVHSGCHDSGSRTFTSARWKGLIRTWNACPDGGTVTESALGPADGSTRPQVYVQVRQQGGGDATDAILRSLRVT
ncbi:serine/threonine protein kinase [Streptomyces diastatochromogenes]|nr:serine/threonine protein kinase [Streptomyces diastatochromogenes]